MESGELEQCFGAAYRATRYVVPSLALALRIGATHADLDAVLQRHGVRSWAFVSACNPYSAAQLCAHENLARHQNLIDVVRQSGWVCFEGAGEPRGGDWAAEPSLLILGIARGDAMALGERFEQNAVVFGDMGGVAELLWCRPASRSG
ncbi:DUF3293 domain-containing protein [Chitiniphilus eburneus]|uniref:DUF3293 domain-containing protein n=1 Tax=Chitiniphilus eburneus TaxID=2571148 RepID=A0A4U0Q7S6_9NEIS|nr:DUF3293 domain-containing protein [Chitiniphilus eburneus]TJZ76332.1 DUF3293 domain-containing protein [Chitiniphilus eburneus]